jgi:isopenicillin N synthase-like dioxygenase
MGRETLPVIAFDGHSDEVLARQLDQVFRDIGFCYFSDIGVDPTLVEGVFQASRRFHGQPRAAKDASP